MIVVGVFSLCLTGCKEDIDESNLYTFTGETIEDYLTNRDDQFSSFNYILKRIGYDKILSAYGTYTCFAPNNQAVESYIDSLYDDVSNEQLPHNGMTSRGLEGLTDSLCKDIALFHLLYSEVMGVDMSNGMTINSMLGRDQYVNRLRIGSGDVEQSLTCHGNGRGVGEWRAACDQSRADAFQQPHRR